jgi:hypothetical protein
MKRKTTTRKRTHKKHKKTTALVVQKPQHAVRLVAIQSPRRKRRNKPRKRHMGMPAALAQWHRDNGHGHKKHRKKPKKHHRKRGGRARRYARRHGRRAIGLARAILPTVPEAVSIGTAALYGKLEGDAAKNKEHILLKVPTPLAIVGRSGNIAVAAWLLGAVTRQPLVRAAATGLVDVAAYQMTRRPEAYGKGGKDDVEFKLAGGTRLGYRRDRTPQIVDRFVNQVGACNDDNDDDDDND